MTSFVSIQNVSIIFGKTPSRALPLIDQGEDRNSIRKKIGHILGIANCSIEVNKGEIVVLMGLSGSGKSTLLGGINGLNRITRGNILVDNGNGHDNGKGHTDLANCDKDSLHQLRSERISMVFQQFALFPWRNVASNIGYGLEVTGVDKEEIKKRVAKQISLVGLEGYEQSDISELSGGMQQRVGLARALATEAPLLLMDEPFSALDPLIRTNLQDELLELHAKIKKTIIFVSHDLDEALKLGDRIAIMEGGHIVQIGTPQDIVLKPANQYVADFVSNINPLNVFRAQEIMQKTDKIPDEFAKMDKHDLSKNSKVAKNKLAVAHRLTSMHDLMRALLDSAKPVMVAEKDSIIGMITMENIQRRLVEIGKPQSTKNKKA